MSIAKEKDAVKVHYTGKLSSGEIFESSLGGEPIEFVIGSETLIPVFENAVIGMKIKDKKNFTINAEDAYGPVVEELIQEIPLSTLPPEIQPEVGMELITNTPDGEEIPVFIIEMTEDAIVVDANHPLAGEDLIFEVQLMEIN